MSPDPSVPPPPAAAGLRPLGAGLCVLALAVNRWSVGWVFAGGDLTGALPNVALLGGQALVFCLGTALLRRAAAGRPAGALLRPPNASVLGAAVWMLALAGLAGTLGPFVLRPRLEEDARLLGRLAEAEGRVLGAELQLDVLVRDLEDGELGAESRALLAESMTVADVLAAGPPAAAGGATAQGLEIAEERTVPGSELAPFAALLAPGLRLEGGRVRWLSYPRRSESGQAESFEGRVELIGRLRSARSGGLRQALRAELAVEWTVVERSLRMSALRVTAAELRSRAGPTFAVVSEPELLGEPSSLTVIDLDGDGADDLFVTSADGPAFGLVDRGGGSFAAADPGLVPGGVGPARAAARADFDGDGRDDLLVALEDGLVLLSGTRRGLGPPQDLGAPFGGVDRLLVGDLDGSGRLDAVCAAGPELWLLLALDPAADQAADLGGYAAVRVELPPPPPAASPEPPDSVPPVDPSTVDPSTVPAELSRGFTAASLADADADGDLDLVVSVRPDGSYVLANDGAAGFAVRGDLLDERPPDGCRWQAADRDADGRADLVALAREDPHADGASFALGDVDAARDATWLYWNDGERFRRAFGPEAESVARLCGSAVDVLDLDGDGLEDLVVSGPARPREDAAWWRDALVGPGGERLRDQRLRRDYRRMLEDRALPATVASAGDDRGVFAPLLRREGGGYLSLEGLDAVLDPGLGEPLQVVWVDLDRDGLPDPVVAHGPAGPGEPSRLRVYHNRLGQGGAPPRRTLALRLRGGPAASLGARVEVETPAGSRRYVYGAGARSGRSGPTRLLVPLGSARVAGRVTVTWPDGRVQNEYDVPAEAELTFHADPEASPSGARVELRPYRARPPTSTEPGG